MRLNCGGVDVQWNENDGKCGVCGDAYNSPKKMHEPGGEMFNNGIITETYKSGEWIPVQVKVIQFFKAIKHSAGWMEFRVCESKDGSVTQECLDKNILTIKDHGERVDVPLGVDMLKLEVKLPTGFVCDRCVFQWQYQEADREGKNPETGEKVVGYGPQSTYRNCADIKIEE
ncbi:hypothetical protein SNEBB_010570 [Seison nebaliae]|nr:hypothetical protein SNEBB_010570 [Seison nebaliae]